MAAIFYTLATLKARLAESDKERGATAVEYALIIAVISIGIIIAINVLSIDTLMANVQEWVEDNSAVGGE